MTSRSPSLEPLKASQGPPGRTKTAQRGAKSGPRAAKTDPSTAQERFRSGLACQLSPNCSPKAPGGLQEAILAPSGLDFGAPGARFSRPRPLPLQPSGEHIRLLLARYIKPHYSKPKPHIVRAERSEARKTSTNHNAQNVSNWDSSPSAPNASSKA